MGRAHVYLTAHMTDEDTQPEISIFVNIVSSTAAIDHRNRSTVCMLGHSRSLCLEGLYHYLITSWSIWQDLSQLRQISRSKILGLFKTTPDGTFYAISGRSFWMKM